MNRGAFRLAALLFALTAWTGPASAHGDERHGEPAPVAAPADEARNGEASVRRSDVSTAAAVENAGAGQREAEARRKSGGILGVLKNLHPATVHFPIALFLTAAIAELILIAKPAAELRAAVRIMVYGGAAGAVVAALFGWIHTGPWFGGDGVMQVHRWNGTALAVAGAVSAALAARTTTNRASLRIILFAIATALLVQGYFGGELAHGPHHLFGK